MRTLLSILILVASLSAQEKAGTGHSLAWDHDGNGVTNFVVTVRNPSGLVRLHSTGTNKVAQLGSVFGSLTGGVYTVSVTAQDELGQLSESSTNKLLRWYPRPERPANLKADVE
jgi:hypothetical protein